MYFLIAKLFSSDEPTYSVEECADIDSLTNAIKRAYAGSRNFRIALELGINFDIVPIEETRRATKPTPNTYTTDLDEKIAKHKERMRDEFYAGRKSEQHNVD